MDAIFGDQYRAALQRGELLEIDEAALQANSRFRSWAAMVEWSNVYPTENTRQDVRQRLNRADWGVDPQTQQRKIDAYNTRVQRKQREQELRAQIKTVSARLKTSRVTRLQERALEQEKSQLKDELKLLEDEDALLIRRVRQYRLKPTPEQARQLKKTMDACRYTHNKCVEYRRKGGDGGKNKLQKLFVARPTQRQVPLEYPEDMGPAPEWVLETPSSVRKHAVSNFVSATSAAFTNLARGHITHFNMHFKSRRESNYFTIYADAERTHLNSARHRRGTRHFGPAPLPRDRKPKKVDQYLTIPSVPNILIRADEGTEIEGEVRIVYAHGYWYAQMPHVVAPLPVEDKGRCTAGDPGLKGFLTMMDLQGNIAHLGRANWDRLSNLKVRQQAAQRRMSRFVANKKYRKRHHLGRHTGREWKQFVAARREFYTVTAKLDNYVKDLHYKAASHLCHNTDVILLPKFSTSSMLRPSAPWTHAFNDQMNTLAHYQFRQRLQAKCEVAGKAMVLCSEMYSSRTCGRCCRLHLTLRN